MPRYAICILSVLLCLAGVAVTHRLMTNAIDRQFAVAERTNRP